MSAMSLLSPVSAKISFIVLNVRSRYPGYSGAVDRERFQSLCKPTFDKSILSGFKFHSQTENRNCDCLRLTGCSGKQLNYFYCPWSFHSLSRILIHSYQCPERFYPSTGVSSTDRHGRISITRAPVDTIVHARFPSEMTNIGQSNMYRCRRFGLRQTDTLMLTNIPSGDFPPDVSSPQVLVPF
jgi:hypothetical protein